MYILLKNVLKTNKQIGWWKNKGEHVVGFMFKCPFFGRKMQLCKYVFILRVNHFKSKALLYVFGSSQCF